MRQQKDAHVLALRDIVQRFGMHRGWSLMAVTAGAVQTLATIVLAASLARVLHLVIVEGQTLGAVQSAWWLVLASIVLRELAGMARDEAGIRLSLAVRRALRQSLLDAVHGLGPAWMNLQQAGSLSTVMLEQVEAFEGYFARYRPQQWLAVLAPVMILLAVFPVSWAAGAIFLLTAPLVPLSMILIGRGTRQRQTEQLQALQRMSGHFLDLIRGLPTLRLLDAHHRIGDEVAQVADQFRRRTMTVLRFAFLSGAVLEFFVSIAIALTAVYFGMMLLGKLDFGLYGRPLDLQIALFVLLLAPEFYLPLRDLGNQYHARGEALAAAGELQAVLGAKSLQPAGGLAKVGESPPGLVLDGVGFSHRDGEAVLSHCSLTIQGGDAVAIQGPSGGGKTTLLRLLLGHLRAQTGQISMGGIAIESLDLTAWRERVARMSQHPRLMADTLAANLRVARFDATDDELTQALAFAGLQEWLQSLPEGLRTRLGEGGRPLSGGQLRRLALARVQLRRADVLLLDEPTASLDADTEDWIVDRIGELAQGKTMVLLTHRPSPLRLAKRVLYLDGGQLSATRPGSMASTARPDTMVPT